eukprot:722102-Pleurochrysis_carterae.AAC.1
MAIATNEHRYSSTRPSQAGIMLEAGTSTDRREKTPKVELPQELLPLRVAISRARDAHARWRRHRAGGRAR